MSVIGIDLGRTSCEIAYFKNGKPEIIPNEFGEKVTPAVLAITEDEEYIIGEYAKKLFNLTPDKVISEVKNLIGSEETITIGDKQLLPEIAAAFILKKLKLIAENYIGKEVIEAIITVPTNFNTVQRKIIKQAGELAGLNVEKVINEPIAAAMAYGLNNIENDEKILVYDLGGRTIDVTILELFSGTLDIKASREKNNLGGKDFDNRIAEYIFNKFSELYNIDVSNNLTAMAKIKEEAEKVKIQLTEKDVTEVNIPFLAIDNNGMPAGIYTLLTRNKFEKLVEDLVQETNNTISEAMAVAGYIEGNIDVVLVVGGASKMPLVRKLLIERFGDKVRFDINPEEAVALGSAVYGAIKEEHISLENTVVVADTCEYTLGISIVQTGEYGRLYHGVFDPVIKKGSKIPCKIKKRYHSMCDYQTEIAVEVFEGVSKVAIDNNFLGKVLVEDIPRALGGTQAVDVTFFYNMNGILEIEAEIESTGRKEKLCIDMKEYKSDVLTMSDVLMKEEKELDAWRNAYLPNGVKLTIELGEKKLEELHDDRKIEVGLLLNRLKQAIINDEKEAVEKFERELTDLLFKIE